MIHSHAGEKVLSRNGALQTQTVRIPGSTGSYELLHPGHGVLKLLPHFKPYLCKELAGVEIGQLILKKLLKHTDYIFTCLEIP